jgi:hypothetical protein
MLCAYRDQSGAWDALRLVPGRLAAGAQPKQVMVDGHWDASVNGFWLRALGVPTACWQCASCGGNYPVTVGKLSAAFLAAVAGDRVLRLPLDLQSLKVA